MINFEQGKIYTLTVDCINETYDGRKYIYFKEMVNGRQLRVRALDYFAQPDADLPATIDVSVKELDMMSGLPVLYFSRTWLIETLFGDESLPKKFSFNVTRIDEGKGVQLKDSYGVDHYLPFYDGDSAANYSVGEHIALFVDAIADNAKKGTKFLKLRKPAEGNQIAQYIRAFTTRDIVDDIVDAKAVPAHTTGSAFTYGIETDTVEFKQSLVFHPKHKEVVAAQIYNIMRSISGFMNNEGGVVYMGVKDDGTVRGIHYDFDRLNEEGGYVYPKNWDGWARKVVDSVRKYLGCYAAGLIKIEKEDHGDLTVGKIVVSPSKKPIYVNNDKLYCRQCNETVQLYGDTLTYFIVERLRGESLEGFVDNKFGYDTDAPDVEAAGDTDAPEVDQTTVSHIAVEEERNQNDWLYIRLFDNGKYILTPQNRRAERYDEGNQVCDYQLKQYHKHEDQVLLLVYNNAFKVNKIDFKVGTSNWYNRRTLMGRDSSAPWAQCKDTNVSIKCVDRNDLLVSFYDVKGKEYCWVRDISDLEPSQKNRDKALFNEGPKMYKGTNIKGKGEIMHIPGSYRNWIAPIVNKECDLNDPSKAKSIQRLISVLKELYPVKNA